MTREELLQELSKTKFCAVPTVQTMDMGIEFDFVDEHGAGTVLGALEYGNQGALKDFAMREMERIYAQPFASLVCGGCDN